MRLLIQAAALLLLDTMLDLLVWRWGLISGYTNTYKGLFHDLVSPLFSISTKFLTLLSISGEPYPAVQPFPRESELIAYVKKRADRAVSKCGNLPKMMVMGALGRCGTGACDFARRIGLPE